MAWRALIIDDEAPARAALRGLLRDHAEIALVGEADTIEAARRRLGEADYELVFLDVHLRGGTGFDLVPAVRAGAKIVFVTGSDQHAVRAFEVNALDYLVKPARPERLAVAVRRVMEAAPVEVAARGLATDDLVYLNLGSGTSRFVALAEIAVISSNQNYSEVGLRDGARLLVRRTMKQWEETLPATHFVRVHRTTIINLVRYRGSSRESYETTLLRLDGRAEPVRASYRYLPELKERLAGLNLQL